MIFELDTIQTLIDKAELEEPTLPFLDECYDKVTKMISHSNKYYKLFYLLTQELKPEVVVELGGWCGYGAAHFAGGNSDTTVITIDHHTDPGDDLNQEIMLECCRQFPNMHYVQGWTTPEYIEETGRGENGYGKILDILNGRKIDVLFIDSWHEGRFFMRDWKYYTPLLNSPALVIADDLFNSELFLNMEETWAQLPYEKFKDKGQMHLGIPMGFLKYD